MTDAAEPDTVTIIVPPADLVRIVQALRGHVLWLDSVAHDNRAYPYERTTARDEATRERELIAALENL